MAEVVKSPAIELRKTGQDILTGTEHEFELGLIIDATASMQEWIDMAKETLLEIVEGVVKENKEKGNIKVKIFVVGYRDYDDRGPATPSCKPFYKNGV